MATLHKFVNSTPTSLTINTVSNKILNYSSYSYWIPTNVSSGTNLQYVDVTNVKNKSIEIVLSQEVNSYGFVSHPDFTSNGTHCQVIPAPTPTIVDGKYHYVFPPNTFTYNRVAGIGAFQKTSGNNHYFYTAAMYSATAGLPTWEDVDIPNYSNGTTFTTETFNTGDTTYQYSFIYYQKYSYLIGKYSAASYGKIKYFALPAGVKQFYTTSPRIAVAETMAVGQQVQYFNATQSVGDKYYYDISNYTFPVNYILMFDSSGNNYDGTGGIDVADWYTGTIHSRVSGSWT